MLGIRKRIIRREDNADYLIRWTLFTCPLFSIKFHKILVSDYDCMHDHPWAFITLLLKGGYVEHTPTGSKIYHPGRLLYRPAKYVHRLEIHQPCYTLVVTFRKVRSWGFITKRGWVPWRQYTANSSCE